MVQIPQSIHRMKATQMRSSTPHVTADQTVNPAACMFMYSSRKIGPFTNSGTAQMSARVNTSLWSKQKLKQACMVKLKPTNSLWFLSLHSYITLRLWEVQLRLVHM